MQKTKKKTLRVVWDGGFGWMEENKKSGGGDVRASNSPSEMAILPLGFAGSDGGFAVGWQFDKFDKFDKFVTLKKLLPGGGARKQLVIRVLCALLAYLRIFWEWVVPTV